MEISTTFIKVFDFNVLGFGISKGYYQFNFKLHISIDDRYQFTNSA